MTTYTPATFWISMPLSELSLWAERASKIVKKGGGDRIGNHI